MPGTKEGAAKAIATMIEDMGEEGYRLWREKTGHKGGSTKKTKPFGFQVMDPERLREVGLKGYKNGLGKE